MPLISVIIPCYNSEDWIEETIKSVSRQSAADIEIIVVDDGSTDGSAAIVGRLASQDSRIKLYRQPNAGPSAARNTGLAQAQGEFVTFVDADDLLYQGALEAMLKVAQATKAPIVSGELSVNLRTNYQVDAEAEVKRFRIVSGTDFMRRMLYAGGNSAGPWARLFERRLFTADMQFRPGIYYEDVELNSRLYPEVGKVALLKTPVYYYRQHSSSCMHRWSERRLDILDVTEEIIVRYSAEYPRLLAAAENRRFAAAFNILAQMTSNNVSLPEVESRCYDIIKNYRTKVLFDPRSRFKVRAGAAISCLGLKATKRFLRLIEK